MAWLRIFAPPRRRGTVLYGFCRWRLPHLSRAMPRGGATPGNTPQNKRPTFAVKKGNGVYFGAQVKAPSGKMTQNAGIAIVR